MGEDEAQQVKVPGQQLHRYIEVGLGSPTAHLLGQRTQSEAVLANQWWHMDTMLCNLKETRVMKGSWDSTCKGDVLHWHSRCEESSAPKELNVENFNFT